MEDDLKIFLSNPKDDHPIHKQALIKYVFNGNEIDQDLLVKYKVDRSLWEYICTIYDWIREVKDYVEKGNDH